MDKSEKGYVSYYLNAMWWEDRYSRDTAGLCEYFLECVCAVYVELAQCPKNTGEKDLLASYVREKDKSTQICLVLQYYQVFQLVNQ